MITIPERKKGAVNSSTVLSINQSRPDSIFSAGNIQTLHKVYSRPSSTPEEPPSQPQNIPAANTGRPSVSPDITAAAPVTKPLPTFRNLIQKGQKIQLAQGNPSGIRACLGWNVNNSQCELDVSAFLLSGGGKVPGDDWFVFYGQDKSPDNSVQFSQINDRSDREQIQIQFGHLNTAIEKIVFVLTIHEATEKNLNFSMVKDAYIRIADASSGEELVSYQMTEYYDNVISMMIGEVYKHNGVWKFNAIGNGVKRDLAGLCELYGVAVEN